jgi:hypothetical protein
MAPPTANPKPKPKPRQQRLELYNSASTGHQVSNGVSKPVVWHKSRQTKLNEQFKNSTLPLQLLASNAATSSASANISKASVSSHIPSNTTLSSTSTASQPPTSSKIFANCAIYISGSTAPHISDHTLRHLLVSHGATVHALLRKTSTTHVILGSAGKVGSGAGGGLAAGKLQKEIDKKRLGGTLKYVSVHWVLDSIKERRRLPEGKYTDIAVGKSAAQGTLGGWVKKT